MQQSEFPSDTCFTIESIAFKHNVGQRDYVVLCQILSRWVPPWPTVILCFGFINDVTNPLYYICYIVCDVLSFWQQSFDFEVFERFVCIMHFNTYSPHWQLKDLLETKMNLLGDNTQISERKFLKYLVKETWKRSERYSNPLDILSNVSWISL